MTATTVSTGFHARRAMELIVAESEKSFLPGPNRWRDVVGRGAGGVREAEREALLLDFFFFFDQCKVFQSRRKFLHDEGTRTCFSSRKFGLISVVFAVLAAVLCRAVFSLSYITAVTWNKRIGTLPTYLGYDVRTVYVGHVSEPPASRSVYICVPSDLQVFSRSMAAGLLALSSHQLATKHNQS